MPYKDVISGIYTITHIASGRVYVGSAAHIYQRWATHRQTFNSDNGKATPYLRHAWRKYGEDAFRFEIVEVVPNKTELLEREQYWIDHYGAANRDKGFNVAPKAGSNLGVKQSLEAINKRVAKIRGRPRSDDFKRQASAWMQGNDNGKGHYWCGHLKESDIMPIFKAIASGERLEDIAEKMNVHPSSIRRVIKRKTWGHVDIPGDIIQRAQAIWRNRRRDTLRADPRLTVLSPNDVAIIKARLIAGESGAALAREYKVTAPAIYAIKHGRGWKDINPAPSR